MTPRSPLLRDDDELPVSFVTSLFSFVLLHLLQVGSLLRIMVYLAIYRMVGTLYLFAHWVSQDVEY